MAEEENHNTNRNPEYDAEIEQLVKEHPKNYIQILNSKGRKNKRKTDHLNHLQMLLQYIIDMTPCLNDSEYTYALKTRVYWLLNYIESWKDPRVKCVVCGNPFEKIDIVNIVRGYNAKTCSADCARKLASKTNKETCLEKYGVENAFLIPEVVEVLDEKREQTKAKARKTKTERYGDPYYNNAKQATKTRIKKYGNNWNQDAIDKTMLERYGVTNPMQCAAIRQKQQQAIYILDGKKFDSSLEVYLYVWLRDNDVMFDFQPSEPEFWYNTDDGRYHRYYPDFIIHTECEYFSPGDIAETKGDNAFDENGYPLKNGQEDWHEKYELMCEMNVKLFMTHDVDVFKEYVEQKYGKDFLDSIKAEDPDRKTRYWSTTPYKD